MKGLLESAVRHHAWARIYSRENKPEEAKSLIYEAALEYCAARMRGHAVMAIKNILGEEAARKYRKQMLTEEYRTAVEMIE